MSTRNIVPGQVYKVNEEGSTLEVRDREVRKLIIGGLPVPVPVILVTIYHPGDGKNATIIIHTQIPEGAFLMALDRNMMQLIGNSKLS